MLAAFRQSLRIKIVAVVLLTTFVALAVSAAALLVYETRTYGVFLIDDAVTQAEFLADIASPALVFDDPIAARTNLELLGTRRDVRSEERRVGKRSRYRMSYI